MTVKGLSETAIEPENNNLIKQIHAVVSYQFSCLFFSCGHPRIHKKCLCMLAKVSFPFIFISDYMCMQIEIRHI